MTPATLTVSPLTYRGALAAFGDWWSPPDGEQITGPGAFVGTLPPPALWCERVGAAIAPWTDSEG